jgi:tyrosyl-tRNA synthetase
MCRGEAAQKAAYAQAQAVFSDDRASHADSYPTLSLNEGINYSLVQFLVDNSLASSKSMARTLIRQGGVKFNDTVILDESTVLNQKDVEAILILSVGKKKHYRVIS